jgi:hypothetical protein
MLAIRDGVRVIALLAAASSFVIADESGGAENSHQARAGSSPGAIAQFMNGRFQVIYLNGRVREFENGAYFFTSLRFSADGRAVVGHLGLDLVVLSQSFETLWRIRAPQPNVWNMALSPLKTQVAFIGPADEGQASLGLVTSSGEKRRLASFRRESDNNSPGLGWSPQGDRLVYGSEGHVKIIDVTTVASEDLGDGFEPTWSPNGKWIAYRRVDGRAELYEVATHQRTPLGRGPKITSMVHWAPDSEYVMVVEDFGGKPTKDPWCPTKTRFVVYGLVDGSRREIFSPCLLRDWYFDWISEPERWISGMRPLR